MTKPQRKILKRKPQWQRISHGWSGSAFLTGRLIHLDFEYSQERVAAVKRIKGARFQRESKSWTVPVESYQALLSSEIAVETRFYFDEAYLELSEEARLQRLHEAQRFVSLNPFVVPDEVFHLVAVDVEILLNTDRRLFILRPKFRSPAEPMFKKLSWLLQSKRERGYLVQAQRVSEIISLLRDGNATFAVSEQAGSELKRTAELRNRVVEAGHGTAEEFYAAYLGPYIVRTAESEDRYRLMGWCPEHLQILFPSIDGFAERKKQAETLQEVDVSELLIRSRAAKQRVWLETALHSGLLGRLEAKGQETEKARLELIARNEKFQALSDYTLDDELLGGQGVADKLYPHQRVAVEWLAHNDRALLGDDMGLGKTVTVLASFERATAEGATEFLLVICPNSLKRNWIREASAWFPKRKLSLVPEMKADRIKFFRHLRLGVRTIEGIVLNYESVRLPSVLEELIEIVKQKKVFLCLDESQRAKNPRSKGFTALSQLAPLASRKVLLSGTPIPRDLSDIWAQIYLLDQGERFGTNFYRWLTQVAEVGTKYSEFAVKKFKKKESDEVVKRVRELLLRRRKEDVLSLPEKTFMTRDIELSGDQKAFYDEVRKELLLRVTSMTGETFLREINNVLEEYLRAVQVASNPRLVDPTWQGDPAKFLECDEIVREVVEEGGGKLVLWTNYLLNIEELEKRYAHLGAAGFSGDVSPEEREKRVREFQTGDSLKILIAVPAAGGVGITLTAAQTAVYIDKTWNAEHFLQSVDRVHRIGQKGTVSIISLHSSKVDELISYNLSRKERVMRALLGDTTGHIYEERLSPEELRAALCE